MGSRKSSVILTMEQKHQIIVQLESDVAVSTIAARYNVHPKTIRRISQDAARINRLVDSNEHYKSIKRLKKPLYGEVENKLYTWFVENRAVGNIMTDALLMKKAMEFAENQQILMFKASRGWVSKFKRRHNIRLFNLHGEKKCADENVAKKCTKTFKNVMEEEDIDIANVYNMDKTGLVWKALPTKTAEAKQKCGGCKVKKDRMTVGLCANVLGSQKLEPLFIHKYKAPRALKNIQNQLPVVLKSQKDEEDNDSDEDNINDQEEPRLSGRTKQQLEELKYIYERLDDLCVTDPPHIREIFNALRRYHFGEYDEETTQRKEVGHSSHPK